MGFRELYRLFRRGRAGRVQAVLSALEVMWWRLYRQTPKRAERFEPTDTFAPTAAGLKAARRAEVRR